MTVHTSFYVGAQPRTGKCPGGCEFAPHPRKALFFRREAQTFAGKRRRRRCELAPPSGKALFRRETQTTRKSSVDGESLRPIPKALFSVERRKPLQKKRRRLRELRPPGKALFLRREAQTSPGKSRRRLSLRPLLGKPAPFR